MKNFFHRYSEGVACASSAPPDEERPHEGISTGSKHLVRALYKVSLGSALLRCSWLASGEVWL